MSASLLTACGNLTVPYKENKLPVQLTQPCSDLTLLDGTTGREILPWAVQTVYQYHDCKARHAALVNAVQQ